MPQEDKSKLASKREFQSEEFQEILGNIPQWILFRGTLFIFIAAFFIIVGCVIFKYPDTISTTMTLTGVAPVSELISRSSGKIRAFYVTDKQNVRIGQYLAVLDNSANTNDIKKLKQYLDEFNIDTTMPLPPENLNLGSIQSTYSNFYTTLYEFNELNHSQYYTKKKCVIKNQINEFWSYNKNIRKKENIINEQLKLYRNQYLRDSLLNNRGMISNEEFEKTVNQYLQIKLTKENIYTTINDLKIQIEQLHENLLDIGNEHEEKRSMLKSKLKTYILQLLAEIQSWELTYVFLSPIDGQVTFTKYWTVNQNVTTGECVFYIVPHDNINIIGKAKMPLRRSGKVKIGQSVNIRLLGFPVDEFGVIKGVVTNISMIPIRDVKEGFYYVVEIGLTQGLITTYNKTIPYLPEMQAQADIITDDLSILERLFMPIRKLWIDGISSPPRGIK